MHTAFCVGSIPSQSTPLLTKHNLSPFEGSVARAIAPNPHVEGKLRSPQLVHREQSDQLPESCIIAVPSRRRYLSLLALLTCNVWGPR